MKATASLVDFRPRGFDCRCIGEYNHYENQNF